MCKLIFNLLVMPDCSRSVNYTKNYRQLHLIQPMEGDRWRLVLKEQIITQYVDANVKYWPELIAHLISQSI